jgi:hypothetical protein
MELQNAKKKDGSIGWASCVPCLTTRVIYEIDEYKQTCTNMYETLMQQYYKLYIIIPYNYE